MRSRSKGVGEDTQPGRARAVPRAAGRARCTHDAVHCAVDGAATWPGLSRSRLRVTARPNHVQTHADALASGALCFCSLSLSELRVICHRPLARCPAVPPRDKRAQGATPACSAMRFRQTRMLHSEQQKILIGLEVRASPIV
jgi:hypothetical protein